MTICVKSFSLIPNATVHSTPRINTGSLLSPPLSARQSNSSSVKLDPNTILPDTTRSEFQQLLQSHDEVFGPTIPGYNGAIGHFEAVMNMGPVQSPQRKGRLPQCAGNKLVELQHKVDELESQGVFQRPEAVGITVEFLNPSFLVQKPSGGYRLVTAFADI